MLKMIDIAKKCLCIECEVYDKSEHIIKFYENRGYIMWGSIDMLKYTDIKMKKLV